MHISIHTNGIITDSNGKPYTVYCIKIRGSKNVVHKRYSDFVKFHNDASKVKSAGVTLPKLPPKKWRNNMDPNFVFNRGLDLEEYLRSFENATQGYLLFLYCNLHVGFRGR
eukprot:Pgem_evm1s20085